MVNTWVIGWRGRSGERPLLSQRWIQLEGRAGVSSEFSELFDRFSDSWLC
jgi:hypothetical protein